MADNTNNNNIFIIELLLCQEAKYLSLSGFLVGGLI